MNEVTCPIHKDNNCYFCKFHIVQISLEGESCMLLQGIQANQRMATALERIADILESMNTDNPYLGAEYDLNKIK